MDISICVHGWELEAYLAVTGLGPPGRQTMDRPSRSGSYSMALAPERHSWRTGFQAGYARTGRGTGCRGYEPGFGGVARGDLRRRRSPELRPDSRPNPVSVAGSTAYVEKLLVDHEKAGRRRKRRDTTPAVGRAWPMSRAPRSAVEQGYGQCEPRRSTITGKLVDTKLGYGGEPMTANRPGESWPCSTLGQQAVCGMDSTACATGDRPARHGRLTPTTAACVRTISASWHGPRLRPEPRAGGCGHAGAPWCLVTVACRAHERRRRRSSGLWPGVANGVWTVNIHQDR